MIKSMLKQLDGSKRPRIGVALGGGGARGICHLAFLQVLEDLGLRPSVMSGTSIGSIIGSFYAAGYTPRRIEQLITSIGFREFTQLLDFSVFSSSGLVKGRGVEEFLCEHLPVRLLEELVIPMHVVATDYWKREAVVFTEGSLISAIRASISIPGLFEPVKIDDRVLVDGGASNPLPVSPIRSQCDLLIAIDVSGSRSHTPGHAVPGMFDSVMNTFQIMEAAITEHQMKHDAPDIYIHPKLENIELLDFYKYKQILASVEEDAACLKETLGNMLQKRQSPRGIGRWFKPSKTVNCNAH